MTAAFGHFPAIPFWEAVKAPPRGRSWAGLIDRARKGELSNRVENVFTSDLARSRAECMAAISRISMHLPSDEWRLKLVGQLDALLDESEWDSSYKSPNPSSFETALRTLLVLQPSRRPGLAIGPNGTFGLMWMNGGDRLSIECLPRDVVRFVLSNTLADGQKERDAGETVIERLAAVLEPFNPGQWLR